MAKRIGIPTFCNLITEADVDKIHLKSVELLCELGVNPNSEKIQNIYLKNGCKLDEKNGNILFSREIIEKYMEMVPSKFKIFGRNPKYDITLPDDAPVFQACGTVSKINDITTGKTRDSVSGDIARSSVYVSKMEGMGLALGAMIPTDVPDKMANLTKAYASTRYTEKPVRIGGVHSVEDADSIVRLGAAIAGSKESFFERPFIICHNTPMISPLKMDTKSAEMLVYFTEIGLPVYYSILPNGGMTSPMSMSGTLTQLNAEFLAVTVLVQMVKAGAQVIYSMLPTIADMRTGSYASGGIESTIMIMAAAQLARRYNVPSAATVGLTNSNSIDAQAGYESSIARLACTLSGVSLFNTAGLLGGLSVSDERMFVVDNDIARMIKRIQQGIDFEEDNIDDAIDAIKDVGTGGMFLQHEHTFMNCHDISFFPVIADRDSRGAWENKGKPDIKEKAVEQIKKWLAEPYDQELSIEAQERVKKEFPDMPSCDVLS